MRIFYTVYFITRRREVRYRRSWKNLACNKSQSLKELCRLLRPGTLITDVLDLARSPLVLRSFVGCNFKKSYSQSLLPHSVTVTEKSRLTLTCSFQTSQPSADCLRSGPSLKIAICPSSATSHLWPELRGAQREIHRIASISVVCPLFRPALIGRPGART